MAKNKDQWVWVVGGGHMQVPMIETIKKAGYKSIVTDINPQAPGSAIADQFVQISTYDVSAHLDLAESMTEKPVAVLTVGADVGPTVSAIADILGLPAAPYDVAVKARNKLAMRRTVGSSILFMEIDANGFSPHSQWKNLCRAGGINPYPCVLKPLELSGSRGVIKVSSPWEWEGALKVARLAGNTRKRTMIVEQFLDAEFEVSLDFFVYNNDLHFANGAYRIFRGFGIEIGHVNPYTPTEEMLKLAWNAASKLEVSHGPFKVDFIVDKKLGPVIVECATRLSGGFDHMTTAPLATGKDITGAMLDVALGKPFDVKKITAKTDGFAAAIAVTHLRPGVVKDWKLPEIDDVSFIVLKNEIKRLEDCTDRAAFAIAKGTTPMGALARAYKAAKNVEVEYL